MVDFTSSPDAVTADPRVAPFDVNAATPPSSRKALLPRPALPVQGLVIDGQSYTTAMSFDTTQSNELLKSIGESIGVALKALNVPPRAYSYASMSFMPDTAAHGLLQWPGINPESLRKVSRENLIPRMIFNERIGDIARYSAFARYPWQTGWNIGMREPSEEPNAQDKKDIKEASNFILNCCRDTSIRVDDLNGVDPRERDAHRILPFDTFMRASIDDMMTFDAWAIWTDRARNGKVNAFTCLPAGNVRLANPAIGYRNNPNEFAALLDETNNPIAGFTRDDMIWRVQYPRTDPSVFGYGYPLIEQAVRVIQAFQAAVDLNASTFDKSGIPNAILKLTGEFFNQDQIDALQREWNNMKKGISKVWGLPVMSIPEGADIELLNLNDVKGMEVRYKDHMNMMIGIWCVIVSFPVRRLGFFTSGHSRDNMPLPDQSVEIQGVDDPGLPPLLTHIENTLNPYIVHVNWPRLAFHFNSKDPKSDARGFEARKLARTWGESRIDTDQDTLQSLATGKKSWLLPLMEVMSLAPEDPAKMAVFGSLAQQMLTDRLQREAIEDGVMPDPTEPPPGAAVGGPGKTPAKTGGAPFPSKTDPAASQEHGHRAGVRRPSGGRHGTTTGGPGGATSRREDTRATGGGRHERSTEMSH